MSDGFFYVEWEGEPCPWCASKGVSGKSPEGHFFAGCPDGDCLAHNLAYDFVTVDHARTAWDSRALRARISTTTGELVEETDAQISTALRWFRRQGSRLPLMARIDELEALLASVGTLPKGQDAKQGLVRSKGDAVPERQTPNA